MNQANQLWGES